MAKKSQSTKSMDISKQGSITPDTTSRPVIVTHKPVVNDPMVKSEKETEKVDNPSQSITSTHNKVIKPLTDEENLAEEQIKSEETRDEAQPTEVASSTTESNPAEPETKPDETIDETNSDSAIVDEIASQAGKNKKPDPKIEEANKKKLADIQKLIDDKKYFLPIDQIAHKRNQITLIIIIVLTLLLAGLYIAIDAELLDLGISLPVEFIEL